MLTAVARVLRRPRRRRRGRGRRDRRAVLADGLLHACPGRGARASSARSASPPARCASSSSPSGCCSPRALALGDFELLAPAVYVLAGLAIITVFQRILHVRKRAHSAPADGCNRGAPGGVDPITSKRDHLEHKRHHQRQRHRLANGAGPLPDRQGPRRHHRRGQLRDLLRPGRPPLQGRRPDRARPRPDARRPRRLPRRATSSSPAAFDIDATKVGKDLGAGHLGRAEQHDQVRTRCPRSSASRSTAA